MRNLIRIALEGAFTNFKRIFFAADRVTDMDMRNQIATLSVKVDDRVDENACIGCSGCSNVCPTGAIDMKTLARFIQSKREDLGLTQKGLSIAANVPLTSSMFFLRFVTFLDPGVVTVTCAFLFSTLAIFSLSLSILFSPLIATVILFLVDPPPPVDFVLDVFFQEDLSTLISER